jgi:hypothetical protein
MDWRYRVTGTVREAESGRALAGLQVRGFDHDLLSPDDALGDARTDAEGHFTLEYTDEAFRSVLDERPDLYLRVFDASGARELHTTRRELRRSASSDEHFDIRIPRGRLEGA